jgi:hypothetical protein
MSLTPKLLLELWYMVVHHLPTLSAKYLAEVFGFHLSSRQKKHSSV